MTRYLVHGYYTNEPQVVIDVVDADSDDAAEAAVIKARGDDGGGYTCDGAEPLESSIAGLLALRDKPAEDVARDLAEIAASYGDEDEDAEDAEDEDEDASAHDPDHAACAYCGEDIWLQEGQWGVLGRDANEGDAVDVICAGNGYGDNEGGKHVPERRRSGD